jgi:hypothetical protein
VVDGSWDAVGSKAFRLEGIEDTKGLLPESVDGTVAGLLDEEDGILTGVSEVVNGMKGGLLEGELTGVEGNKGIVCADGTVGPGRP